MSAVISRSGSSSDLITINISPNYPTEVPEISTKISSISGEILPSGKKSKNPGKDVEQHLRELNTKFLDKLKVLKRENLKLNKENDSLKAQIAEEQQKNEEVKNQRNEDLKREEAFTQGHWQAEELKREAQDLQTRTKMNVDDVKQIIFKKEPSVDIFNYVNSDKVNKICLNSFKNLDNKNQENREVRKSAFDLRNQFANNANAAEVSLRQCDNLNALYANFSEIRPVRKLWEAVHGLKAEVENIASSKYPMEFRARIEIDSTLSDAKKELYIADEYAKHIGEEYKRLQIQLKATKGQLDALNVAGDDPHNPAQTRIVRIFDELNKRVKEYSDNSFAEKYFEFYRDSVKKDTEENIKKDNEEISKDYTDARKLTSEWWNSSLNMLREVEVTIDLFGENLKVIQPLSQAYDEVDVIKRELKKKGKIDKDEFKQIGEKFITVCNKYFSAIQNYYKFDEQYSKAIDKLKDNLQDKAAKNIIDSYAIHVDAPREQIVKDILNTYGDIQKKIDDQKTSLKNKWDSLNARLNDTVNDLDYALTKLQKAWGFGYYIGQGGFRKTYNEVINEAQKRKNVAQESEPNPVFKLGVEL